MTYTGSAQTAAYDAACARGGEPDWEDYDAARDEEAEGEMSEATTGPWTYDLDTGMVLNADGHLIVDLPINGRTSAQNDAYGRLIAAAPDLRDALRLCVETINGRRYGITSPTTEVEAAAIGAAALAKAEGSA